MINDKIKVNQEDMIGNECGVGVGLIVNGQRQPRMAGAGLRLNDKEVSPTKNRKEERERKGGGSVRAQRLVGITWKASCMSRIEKGMDLTTVGHLWSQQKSSVIVFVQ